MNISVEDRKLLIQEWEKVLIEAYDADKGFPHSCGYATQIMVDRIKELGILKDFTVSAMQGWFVDEDYECEVEELESINEFDRLLENFEEVPCENCTCYMMNRHSYIGIVDNRTGETGLLDFTRYQFEEKFNDWFDKFNMNEFEFLEEMIHGLMEITDFEIKDTERYR